jgi:hypothetical protein
MEINSCVYENVFYGTYQNDEHVDYSDSVMIEKARIIELLDRVGAMKNNFIGFTDNEGTTIQFYVVDLDDICVEIPIEKEKGSYSKQISEAEMHSIVQNLKTPYIIYKSSLCLAFQEW